ncbi:MAG: hypothetical protein U5R49_19880 [Deltaproteobacteria bacterium]|nr:hypothetical protein [Deltaproteobacteria bacterium]
MAESVRIKNTGLRGVTVADSKISFIDAEKGVLIYRALPAQGSLRGRVLRTHGL